MQKIIKEVDEKRGIVQVTTADERWYLKQSQDPKTKLPIYKGVPSVTWIAGHYPKGIPFYKWLAEKGWDESQAIKNAAGDKGSKVHMAISAILAGEEVRIDSKFVNPSTEKEEELTIDEIDCIKSFVDWRNEVKPESIAWDITVFSDNHNYAGTIDYICKIDGKVYIVDFKTSQSVWTEYELQVSAYKQALIEAGDKNELNLAILQIGYKRNKAMYKWNELEDKFPLFLHAKAIWAEENGDEKPKQKDYPIILSPAVTVEEALKDENK